MYNYDLQFEINGGKTNIKPLNGRAVKFLRRVNIEPEEWKGITVDLDTRLAEEVYEHAKKHKLLVKTI